MTITQDVDHILATIRAMESGGNYTARNKTSTASGAYQYLDSTWNGFGGYAHAYQAPPAVQDARARSDVTRILAAHPNDITAVPQFWYYPAGYGHPNLVPPGNSLSIGAYVSRWMAKYNSIGSGSASAPAPALGSTSTGSGTQLASFDLAKSGTDPNAPAALNVLRSLDGVLNSGGGLSLLNPITDLKVIVARSAIVVGGLIVSTFGLILIVSAIGNTKSGGAAVTGARQAAGDGAKAAAAGAAKKAAVAAVL